MTDRQAAVLIHLAEQKKMADALLIELAVQNAREDT